MRQQRLNSGNQLSVSQAAVWMLFSLVCLSSCSEPPSSPAEAPPPLVKTVTAKEHGKYYSIRVSGFVQAPEQIQLVTEVSGVVAEKSPRLETGKRFDKGEVLFQLEQTDYKAKVMQAEAELDNANVALQKAEDNLSRIRQLAAQNTASEARLDDAQLALTNAQARHKQAEAALLQAREALDDTVLKAPFDALILSENVSVGAYFSPAQPALALIGAEQLDVNAGLTPEQVAAVSRRLDSEPGAPIRIHSEHRDGTFKARLVSVSPAVDELTRTLNYRVRLDRQAPAQAQPLKVGEYVEVEFPASAEQQLLWLPEAVIRQDNHLYRITQQNQLQRVRVTPIARVDGGVLIEQRPELTETPLLLTSLANEADGLTVRRQDP